MTVEQEGIVWKRYPGLPMADGSTGDRSKPDYSRFGARLQREFSEREPGTVIPVYEMPDDLLRAPTPLELQLFEPALYLPEAPTVPVRVQARAGRLHARIYYSVGNTGLLRLDCDWFGSVPIVAHKALTVAVVTDRFYTGDDPSFWESDFTFSDGITPVNPGTAQLSFDSPLPEVGSPINDPPSMAYLSRESISTLDAASFTGTHDRMTLLVSWGTTSLRFNVGTIIQHDDYLEIALSGLVAPATMEEALADGEPLIVRFDNVSGSVRLDVSVGLMIGERTLKAPPTYTFPTTPLAADETATFPVPALARKLRCSLKYGEAPGSLPDAPLGQYFVAFVNRAFGALAWIDAASAREGLFGDGLFIPPGTHAITIENRSTDAVAVTPSFVLGI